MPTSTLRKLPWELLGRPDQHPPAGDWLTWLILAGRGWGKTRTGAEWVQANHAKYGRWILAGATASDVRDIMIEGESGILAVAREDRPRYEPSKSRLTWPNGAIALLLSADEPDRFRGKQSEAAWLDEVASWRYPEAWDQLQLGLRLGSRPRQIVTTTPRPTALIRRLVADSTTVVTRGSTYDNRPNLAADFFRQVVSRYEGTRLGRQELHAEILSDIEGALWKRDMIRYDRGPVKGVPGNAELQPDYLRVVVAIDPAVTYGPESDETGIIVAAKGTNGRGYVLDDLTGRFSPDEWARRAVAAYDEYQADAIVAEVNNGGDLVENLLRGRGWRGAYRAVHASRGKRTRAEPISGLYEQGRVSHVRAFPELEDQLCNFTPETLVSPDRLDALVWAFTDLMLGPQHAGSDFSMIA